MRLFTKLTIVFMIFFLLLILTLVPAWSAAAANRPGYIIARISEAPQSIQTVAVITFTPVATVYLPLVANDKESPDPEPTEEPAPTAVRIIRIEYDPDVGTDAEGEYVELQNFGPSAVDMTDWTLRDEISTTFTFPSFSLTSQAKVRVWVKDGVDDATNLYWGRGSAVWNNGGDTAFLSNADAEEVDRCSYPGGAPGFFECN